MRHLYIALLTLPLLACPPDKKQSEDVDTVPLPAEPNAPGTPASTPGVTVHNPNLVPPHGGQPARPLVAPSAH